MLSFDALYQQYAERFGVVPPFYYGAGDEEMAELYQRALDRGEPLGDDDDLDTPEDAVR